MVTTVYSPLGMLGYGFPERSLHAAMEMRPDVIALDAGSIDPGPYYLGSGESVTSTDMVMRDLNLLLPAAVRAGVPLLIGTAGGSGAQPHLDRTVAAVKAVAERHHLRFGMAVISSDIPKTTLLDAIELGQVDAFEADRPLTSEDVDACEYIVGQMGVEPFIDALGRGVQVVVAGRAYDASMAAVVPILAGVDPGLALHMGKIVECGSQIAVPRESDGVVAEVHSDYFTVSPADPEKRCVVSLAAGHSLYENADPLRLGLPGGHLDLSAASYRQLDDRRVKIEGSRFVAGDEYTIKLEGSALVGYRSVCLGGIRDPYLIEHLDQVLGDVEEKVRANLHGVIGSESFDIMFRVYGRDAVMGAFTPTREVDPTEVGLLIDVVAASQDTADTVVRLARSVALHMGYPGRKATAGNLAFPFSPAELRGAPVYEFRIYHLLRLASPDAAQRLFPIECHEVGG